MGGKEVGYRQVRERDSDKNYLPSKSLLYMTSRLGEHLDHVAAVRPEYRRRINRFPLRGWVEQLPVICFGLAVAVATLPGAASANHPHSWTIAGASCVPVGQTSSSH